MLTDRQNEAGYLHSESHRLVLFLMRNSYGMSVEVELNIRVIEQYSGPFLKEKSAIEYIWIEGLLGWPCRNETQVHRVAST